MFVLTTDSVFILDDNMVVEKIKDEKVDLIKVYNGDTYKLVKGIIYRNDVILDIEMNVFVIYFWFSSGRIICYSFLSFDVYNLSTLKRICSISKPFSSSMDAFIEDDETFWIFIRSRKGRCELKKYKNNSETMDVQKRYDLSYQLEFSEISTIHKNFLVTTDGDIIHTDYYKVKPLLGFDFVKSCYCVGNKIYIHSRKQKSMDEHVGIFSYPEPDKIESKIQCDVMFDLPYTGGCVVLNGKDIYVCYCNGIIKYNELGVELSRLGVESMVSVCV